MEVVAVIGASSNETRYSNQAINLLQEYGHQAIPVSPRESEILGLKVYSNLDKLIESKIKVDTVTMYVNAQRSNAMTEDLIRLAPKRVIFNPGSENSALMEALKKNKIATEEACTLVLLRTHQF